jgi:hypothetical protein
VAWSIDGREINEEDPSYEAASWEGEQTLDIVQPDLADSAIFSCRQGEGG